MKYTITKGFSAFKGKERKDVKVEVHSLGFYISTHTNGRMDNQVPRSTLKKANEYIAEQKRVLEKKKFNITPDTGVHKVVFNTKTLTFNTLL